MNVAYQFALFIHIVGALGIFIGAGLELAVATRLRGAANVGQVREALWYGKFAARVMQVAPPVTLLAGLYMTITVWGFGQAWLDVALAAFLVLAVMGPAVNGRHFKALAGQAFSAPEGPLPPSLRTHIFDPAVNTILQTMAALSLGIVFLMTLKPSLVWSLVTVVVALALGLLSAAPVRRAARELRAQPAAATAGHTLASTGQ